MPSRLKWFQQGQSDGLCGFYAALNAMWALYPELRDREFETTYKIFSDGSRRQVFDEAVGLLSRVGGVTINVVQSHPAIGGIDWLQIEDLLTKMGNFWGLRSSIELLGDYFPNSKSAQQMLSEDDPLDSFSAVCGYKDGSHWVTLHKTKSQPLLLIDPSSGEIKGTGISRFKKLNLLDGVLIRKVY